MDKQLQFNHREAEIIAAYEGAVKAFLGEDFTETLKRELYGDFYARASEATAKFPSWKVKADRDLTFLQHNDVPPEVEKTLWAFIDGHEYELAEGEDFRLLEIEGYPCIVKTTRDGQTRDFRTLTRGIPKADKTETQNPTPCRTAIISS
jgi:hypothetical protein